MNRGLKFSILGLSLVLLSGCVVTVPTYTDYSYPSSVVTSRVIVTPWFYPKYKTRYKYRHYYSYPQHRYPPVPYKKFKKGPSPYYERYFSPRKHID